MARRKLWKGLVAGSVAGLAGTVAMTAFQSLWSKAFEKMKRDGNSQGRSETRSAEEQEDATMKAAGRIAEMAGTRLSHETKKKAGPVVHYAFGTGMGALYGILAEYAPRDLRRRWLLSGIGFGSVLFAGADEIAVPALGLSKPPSESPLSSHGHALASHVVYGLTSGTVRKAVRAAL